MTEREITKQLGEPLKLDLRKLKAIGSTGYFLKSFTAKDGGNESLKLDSKCNFEIRPKGLLLGANYSNQQSYIPFPQEQIISITIQRGEEKITPFLLSPLWIMVQLGVPIVIARNFRIHRLEYSIDQMDLEIVTQEYEMEFIANGYLYEGQQRFFESLNYGEKLEVIKPASTYNGGNEKLDDGSKPEKLFNLKIFNLAFSFFLFLLAPSVLAAMAQDEGTLPDNPLWQLFADLFDILRFPSHNLLESYIMNGGYLIFFGGLVLNCIFYGLIAERLIYLFRALRK